MCMQNIASPLGSVTVRSSRMLDFTKIGMATAIPAIHLLPALEGYGIHFYRIFLSLYGS